MRFGQRWRQRHLEWGGGSVLTCKKETFVSLGRIIGVGDALLDSLEGEGVRPGGSICICVTCFCAFPRRSMQYSVWYITQENSSTSSPTVVYEPFTKIIQHGMDYMREHIKLPITSHNRAWYCTCTQTPQKMQRSQGTSGVLCWIYQNGSFRDVMFSSARAGLRRRRTPNRTAGSTTSSLSPTVRCRRTT